MPKDEAVASRGGHVSSDPAIIAAFGAFHRKASQFRSSALGGALLPRASWVFAGLALLSFAGGLSLALFSFNTPERPITIAGAAPEMLYVKPATADTVNSIAAQASAVADSLSAPSIAAKTPSLSSPEPANGKTSSPRQPDDADAELLATTSSGDAPLPDATANLAAAMRFGAVAGTQAQGRTGGGDVTVGYDAVELPSIPEPASGPIIAVGIAAVFGVTRLPRSRRRS